MNTNIKHPLEFSSPEEAIDFLNDLKKGLTYADIQKTYKFLDKDNKEIVIRDNYNSRLCYSTLTTCNFGIFIEHMFPQTTLEYIDYKQRSELIRIVNIETKTL